MREKIVLPLHTYDLPLFDDGSSNVLLPVLLCSEKALLWLMHFYHQLLYIKEDDYFCMPAFFAWYGFGRELIELPCRQETAISCVFDALQNGYYVWTTIDLDFRLRANELPHYLIFSLNYDTQSIGLFGEFGNAHGECKDIHIKDFQAYYAAHPVAKFLGVKTNESLSGFNRVYFQQQLTAFLSSVDLYHCYYPVSEYLYGIDAYRAWTNHVVTQLENGKALILENFIAARNHASFFQYRLHFLHEHGVVPDFNRTLWKNAAAYAELTEPWPEAVRQYNQGERNAFSSAFPGEAKQAERLLINITKTLRDAMKEEKCNDITVE